jgi:hypothetical protein
VLPTLSLQRTDRFVSLPRFFAQCAVTAVNAGEGRVDVSLRKSALQPAKELIT